AGVRPRVTGVLRTGDAVVAVRVGVAAARLGGEVAHARHRIAAVERADVVIVAVDRRPVAAHAGPHVTGFHARAEVVVGALRIGAAAARDGIVDAGPVAVVGHGVAGVGRADDAVVAARRCHDGRAGAADAGLLAVTELAVVTHDRGAGAHVVAADVARGARVQVVTRGGVAGVRARAEPVALVVGADVPVVGARRLGRRAAIVGRLVAGVVALGPARARVAAVRTDAAAAGVGAVAEKAIVAGGGVVRVRAGACPVAHVVGADFAVAGAGRPRARVAVVGRLAARVVALEAARARVAAVRARAAAARVGAVAEEPVVAGGGVRRVRAGAGAVAGVVGADVVVTGAGRARCRVAGGRGLVAGVVALGAAGAGIAAVRTDAAAAGVGAVAEDPVVAGSGVRRVRAGAGAAAGIVGAEIAVRGAGRPRGGVAVLGRLVARVVALGAAGARVAAVRAHAVAARVGAVAEDPVVAGVR